MEKKLVPKAGEYELKMLNYNLSGWVALLKYIREWGIDFEKVAADNGDDPISPQLCLAIADALEAHYDELPADLIYYGASDYAVTDGTGDFTEHGIFATDYNGNLYVIDWWKGQTNADVWIDKKLDLCQKYKPVRWFSEGGVIRRSIEPFLRKRMTERKIYQSIDWLSSISDKTTRARSIQGRFSMGMVYFPINNSWVNELKKQLLAFPAGKYDDGVDVFSLIGRGLDTLQNAQVPKSRKPAPATGTIEWLLSRTDKPKEVSKFRA